jgi:hypothetical protein
VSGAIGVAAAADLQAQADQSLQGDDGLLLLGRGPERSGAGGAGACGWVGSSRVRSAGGRALRRVMGLLLEAVLAQGLTNSSPFIKRVLPP